MALTDVQLRAIEVSLGAGLPFVAYSLPDDDAVTFFADPDGGLVPVRTRFGIFPWLSDNGYYIGDRLTAEEVVDGYRVVGGIAISPAPLTVSTPRPLYLERVSTLIGNLKKRGGKTVYSRVLCGGFSSPAGPFSAIKSLFRGYTSTFNAVYYHPAVGAWMLSSPELLLKSDLSTGEFETMSLAGTRPASEAGLQWDEKNMNEQHIVTEYICDTLRGLGLSYEVCGLETVTNGRVQHLRNIIKGMGVDNPQSVAASLSPTPALGGFPVKEALADIETLELQPRRCYGGFLSIDTTDAYRAYVNLRCCQFDMRCYCLYAGGGITPMSNPEAEWDETVAKLSRLLPLMNKA